MKMQKIFVAALAAVTLVSCSKDDLGAGGNSTGANKVVALNVANQTLTRSLAEGVEKDHKVGFEGGYIVFADAAQRITDVFYLTNDSSDPVATPADTLDVSDPALNTIFIDDIEDNYFFRVNSDAKFVHVFGNTDKHGLVFNTNSKGAIDTYLNNFLVVAEDLSDASGAVKNVPLYGTGAIQNYSDGPGDFSNLFSGEVEKIAQVKIAPIASRLELAKTTATAAYTAPNNVVYTISDYKIEAIFLNYFHKGMAYNGSIASSSGFVAFNSLDDFKEDGSSTSPWYNFGKRGKFHDYDPNNGIAVTNSLVATPNYTVTTPGSTATWSYNMFQASPVASQKPEEALPHMVIKLKPTVTKSDNSAFEGVDEDGYSYITVRYYTNRATGNELTAFEGGMVYHIENLPFDASNLKPVPEWREPVTVEVLFKVMNWDRTVVDITLD